MVDLADARVRLRTRSRPSTESLTAELDQIRSLFDQAFPQKPKTASPWLFQMRETIRRFWRLPRCALATALEQQGHYRDALAAVAMYEAPESTAKLDDKTIIPLRVQIGLGYNYTGDHPKAIAMLKSTVRDYSERALVWVRYMRRCLAFTGPSVSIRLRGITRSERWRTSVKLEIGVARRIILWGCGCRHPGWVIMNRV